MMIFRVGEISGMKPSDGDEFPRDAGFIRTFSTVASHRINDLCVLNQRRDLIDLNVVKTHLFNEGRLSEKQVLKVINDSSCILRNEPNLLRINKEVIIIGDIHGQFYDLFQLLENVDLEKETLVFLGDYVDRGAFSTEVYFYLLLLKIHYPQNVYLLRGNHESEKMTRHFTFMEECRNKYSSDVYMRCLESFNSLPLAAVVLDKMYCSHGGISPRISLIDEINEIDRFTEMQSGTPECDILWTDPHPSYGEIRSEVEFIPNAARRCSYYYTYEGVTRFLKRNNLMCMVRGHEVQEKGYMMYEPLDGIPSVITIFSAPNYCDSYGNRGAILRFDGDNLDIKTFESKPHPFCLPNWMDGINWTYPFVAEKISEFYLDLLKNLGDVMDEEVLIDLEIEKSQSFACSMAVIRSERENLCELEDEESEMVPTIGISINNHDDDEFNDIKVLDAPNESIPDELGSNGMSMDIPPSLVPPITRNLGGSNLDGVLDDSHIILNDKDELEVDVRNKEGIDDEDKSRCWCF